MVVKIDILIETLNLLTVLQRSATYNGIINVYLSLSEQLGIIVQFEHVLNLSHIETFSHLFIKLRKFLSNRRGRNLGKGRHVVDELGQILVNQPIGNRRGLSLG